MPLLFLRITFLIDLNAHVLLLPAAIDPGLWEGARQADRDKNQPVPQVRGWVGVRGKSFHAHLWVSGGLWLRPPHEPLPFLGWPPRRSWGCLSDAPQQPSIQQVGHVAPTERCCFLFLREVFMMGRGGPLQFAWPKQGWHSTPKKAPLFFSLFWLLETCPGKPFLESPKRKKKGRRTPCTRRPPT